MFALSARRLDTPKTFALEPALPRLPVQALRDTLSVYQKSLLPFYAEQGLGAKEIAKREGWANEFEQSELGRTLQQRLLDIDRCAPFNWLDDAFWLRYAYHSDRRPLPINSSWWCLAGPSGIPDEVFLNPPATGQFSEWQIRRAALLVSRFLDFKLRLDREDIPPDSSRSGPFCMHQYRRIYGITRLPGKPEDHFLHTPHPATTRHILVIAREQLYVLDVVHLDGRARSRREIEAALWAIAGDVEGRAAIEFDPAICSLTGADRDTWTDMREHLASLSEQNRESLDLVESSLFSLALDDWTRIHPHPKPSRASRLSESTAESSVEDGLDGHILNGQAGGPTPGRSRWFDKSIIFCVENNARASVIGEHSPCEALLPAIVIDYALAERLEPAEEKQDRVGEGWYRLQWDTDDRIERGIVEAQEGVEALVEDSDARILLADEYGVTLIRQVAKLPPDPYIQMALQLAYRRLHGCYTAVYETASTRLYLHGRTETIRSFTAESRAFCEAMVAGSPDTYALLQRACMNHASLIRQCSLGHGCDRHLLALRLLLREGETLPTLFTDELFDASQDFRLSTSGLTAGDRFAGTGFGAPLQDGYGINYLAGNELIKFGIESKHSSTATDTSRFRIALVEALREMRKLCEDHAASSEESSAKL